MRYTSGLDRIADGSFSLPPGKGGLITNMSAVSSGSHYAFDIIPSVCEISKIFSPEHGLFGVEEAGAPVTDTVYRGIPVISLYGDKKAPSKEDMEGLDYLVFDIQDTGLRIYTYLYTLTFCMKAAAEKGIPIFVLDRPNPLNGNTVEGNLIGPEYRSFVGMHSIPQRYGLTIGEYAEYIRETEGIDADLTIAALRGWKRDRYLDEYDNHFNHPSPNLPSFESILNYAATSIFEGTNISEGRGTTMPFLLFGAPWIDEEILLELVTKEQFPGTAWKKILFKPSSSKHEGKICRGLRMYVTDRDEFSPVFTGLRLVKILEHAFPSDFRWLPPFKNGQKPFIEYLTGGKYIYTADSAETLRGICVSEIPSFMEAVQRFRIYE